jgi:hypothetical protein
VRDRSGELVIRRTPAVRRSLYSFLRLLIGDICDAQIKRTFDPAIFLSERTREGTKTFVDTIDWWIPSRPYRAVQVCFVDADNGCLRHDRPSTQDRIPRTVRWRSSEKECHAETTTAAEPWGVPEPAPPASRDRAGVYGIAIKALWSDAYLQARQVQPALLRPDVIVRINQRYRYNPLNQWYQPDTTYGGSRHASARRYGARRGNRPVMRSLL